MNIEQLRKRAKERHREQRRTEPGAKLSDAQLDEALAYAARSGRLEVLGALVGHGARVDADVYRGTPLIWAASTGRAEAVKRLLALGADPPVLDGHGYGTPAGWARHSGHDDVAELLDGAGR